MIKTENLDEPIDLSSVEMTHYKLRMVGERDYRLGESEKEYELQPADGLGSGTARDPKGSLRNNFVEMRCNVDI